MLFVAPANAAPDNKRKKEADMRFLHLSDLHLGKRVHGFSMIEDQKHILQQIEAIARAQRPQAVLIAGDLYDKGVPPTEAVELLDGFLTRLLGMGAQVLIVSGNHDSPERLGFAGQILSSSGLHIAGALHREIERIRLTDETGSVDFYLLPYVKAAKAAALYPQAQIDTCDAAVRAMLADIPQETGVRRVLVAHQFVAAPGEQPERCDSETLQVGGVDSVMAGAFEGFDYVALGHLHRAQRVGRETVRYAGSPLKYSFSEARGGKSATLVELGTERADVKLLPLTPQRDMRELRGRLQDLIEAAAGGSEDYVRAVLTDTQPLYDAIGQLRRVYPNVMELAFERDAALAGREALHRVDVRNRTPLELFEDFFAHQAGDEMTEMQREVVLSALKRAQDMGKEGRP